MIVYQRLWRELKWANSTVKTIQKYTSARRKWNRRYETFIALTASAGAFGFIYDHIIPFVSTLIIGLVSVAKAIFPSMLQKEEDLSTLDNISDFYLKYKNEIEKLLYNLKIKKIDENEAAKRFFKLKETETDKQSIMNKLLRKIPNKIHKEVEEESDCELKEVYYEYAPENESTPTKDN